MKYLGYLLLTVSLAAGALAAAMAYHVPLTLPDEFLHNDKGEPLSLKADAGAVVVAKDSVLAEQQDKHRALLQVQLGFPSTGAGNSGRALFVGLLALGDEKQSVDLRALSVSRINTVQILRARRDSESGAVILADGLPVALAHKGDRLTAELLQALRERSASSDPRVRRFYVMVQEFSLARWPGLWAFVVAVLGLLAGAVLVRASARRSLRAAGGGHPTEGPLAALQALKDTLHDLQRRVGSPGTAADETAAQLPLAARLQAILQQLGDVQRTHMQSFIDARPVLISRLGLAGFAELMDSYAACERQIHRAWSAAADGYYEEAVECLDRAVQLIDETLPKLRRT